MFFQFSSIQSAHKKKFFTSPTISLVMQSQFFALLFRYHSSPAKLSGEIRMKIGACGGFFPFFPSQNSSLSHPNSMKLFFPSVCIKTSPVKLFAHESATKRIKFQSIFIWRVKFNRLKEGAKKTKENSIEQKRNIESLFTFLTHINQVENERRKRERNEGGKVGKEKSQKKRP